MARVFASVAATAEERRAARPGDDIIARPDVVMDRAFTVAAPPAAVWPWIVQLGKKRAGWYLPRAVERFLPRKGRAVRDIYPAWQHLGPGDIVSDYGGRDASLEVAAVDPPSALVYRSVRGRTTMTWSLTLRSVPADTERGSRSRQAPRATVVRNRSTAWLNTSGSSRLAV